LTTKLVRRPTEAASETSSLSERIVERLLPVSHLRPGERIPAGEGSSLERRGERIRGTESRLTKSPSAKRRAAES
jgi:hypothetical protein